MGMIVAITAPRLSSTFSKATLGGGARGLAGAMAYLRNAAAREGRSYFLTVDLDQEEYWAAVMNDDPDLIQTEYQDPDALDDAMYTEVTKGLVSRTRLRKAVAFSHVEFQDGGPVSDGTVRIEFRPDGTADEAVVCIAKPNGRAYTVYLEQYNGQATVYKGMFVPEPPPVLTERERPSDPRDAL